MTIKVERFWTDYRADENGALTVPVDMVSYFVVGQQGRSVTISTVKRILDKVIPLEQAPDNPAVQFANYRKEVIQPLYDNYKKGNEIPEHGTPLGAWGGVNSEQATALKQIGFTTVEEIAECSESALAKLPLPNPKQYKKLANDYLVAKDANKLDDELSKRDDTIAQQQSELEEMKQILLDMQKQVGDKPVKKGRPKKAEAA